MILLTLNNERTHQIILAKPHVNWKVETGLEYVGHKSCNMLIVKK